MPVLLFSGSENIKELGGILNQKFTFTEVYEKPENYISKLESGEKIPENSVILLDNDLEEPWTMEKTMLKLKQQQPQNAHFVAVVKERISPNQLSDGSWF